VDQAAADQRDPVAGPGRGAVAGRAALLGTLAVPCSRLENVKGRIVVDEFLTVPGHPDIFAAGDAAAASDLTRPGQLTAMTAQHAQRQGKAAAATSPRPSATGPASPTNTATSAGSTTSSNTASSSSSA
jgi:NADH dehydrogenase FAD-containing subunit